jgi:arylsulfatase A-like enzyme
VVFKLAYAAGTSCASSRFSLFTGRYCSCASFSQADPLIERRRAYDVFIFQYL